MNTEESISTKQCDKCKEIRPLWQFYSRVRSRDKAFCKFCSTQPQMGPQWRFSVMKTKAKTRNAEWLLSFEDYSEIIKNPCHYCEGPLAKTGAGLDRKVKADYTIDNVVPCCAICNWLKHDIFTYEEMLELGQLVKKFRLNRGLGPDEAILMPRQRYKYTGPIVNRRTRRDKGVKRGPRSPDVNE